ncbi:MAG TPA: hypothetical protein VHA57_13390 [Actinomycetota bacterium]|nr:hypothetical protein [Actinomycetota bacterium]
MPFVLAIPAAIVVIAVWGFLRMRRHGESVVPAAGWQPSAESFRDPSSGRLMRVWIDPADGSRHYVPEGGPAQRR